MGMTASPSRFLRALLVIVVYAMAYIAPEAAAGPRRFQPLDAPLQDATKALLVFVVDAPYAVRAVVLTDEKGQEAARLELGTAAGEYSTRVFALPPGKYHITSLLVPDFQRAPYEIHDAPWFVITPGQLNYIGDFELYRERDDLMCRMPNRSGRMIIQLRERTPALIQGLAVAYVGGTDEGWVEALSGAKR